MSRPRGAVATAVLLSLLFAACGNSGDDAETGASTTEGDGTTTTVAGNRDEFVPITGVPGVTDEAITYAVVGTKANNPLGTCILDCYLEGIQAYFDFRNSEGGIFGRDLEVGQVLDDELGQNQVRSLDVISSDQAFGAFQATLLATGWGDLDSAGVPTYAWGINANEAADRQHIFPSAVIPCADCTQRTVPHAAQLAGATKAASLGYGVTENSKVCTNSVAKSFELYEADTGVASAYVNDNLAYGLPNGIGPEVTAMKNAGVDFISTCIDLNGMKTLARELARQGMGDVPLYHPNTYNQAFVQEAGDLFDGDYISVQFRPFEADSDGTALEDFLHWMDEGGNEPSELAMVGWINASLAFDGLLAAGPDFDRDKVTAATNAMDAFSAGGLIEPIDWGEGHDTYTQATRGEKATGLECAALIKVEGSDFTVVAPADKPWFCWPQATLDWSEPEPTNFE